jgi:glycopeptide antibiotics resistance protein
LRSLGTRNTAVFLSVAVVLAFTLGPTAADTEVMLVPFEEHVEAAVDADAGELVEKTLESIGNVLLFVPLGAALAFRGLTRRRSALIGLAFAATIEAAQYFVVPGRTAAVDDLLLNGLGVVLGHAALTRLRAR